MPMYISDPCLLYFYYHSFNIFSAFAIELASLPIPLCVHFKIFFMRHTDGQKSQEKMLNITNYQRNANQDYNEVSIHASQNGHHQKVHKK